MGRSWERKKSVFWNRGCQCWRNSVPGQWVQLNFLPQGLLHPRPCCGSLCSRLPAEDPRPPEDTGAFSLSGCTGSSYCMCERSFWHLGTALLVHLSWSFAGRAQGICLALLWLSICHFNRDIWEGAVPTQNSSTSCRRLPVSATL